MTLSAGTHLGAYQIASRCGTFQQTAIIHFYPGGLCRVKQIRHVYKDAHIMRHTFILLSVRSYDYSILKNCPENLYMFELYLKTCR